METAPVIVTISAFRKQVSAFIETATRDEVPVFITQHGFDTAVLLSRAVYRRLLWAREPTSQPGGGHEPGDRQPMPGAQSAERPRPNPKGPTFIKIAEGRTVRCDPEMAQFLLDQGHEIDDSPGLY